MQRFQNIVHNKGVCSLNLNIVMYLPWAPIAKIIFFVKDAFISKSDLNRISDTPHYLKEYQAFIYRNNIQGASFEKRMYI